MFQNPNVSGDPEIKYFGLKATTFVLNPLHVSHLIVSLSLHLSLIDMLDVGECEEDISISVYQHISIPAYNSSLTWSTNLFSLLTSLDLSQLSDVCSSL